MTTTTITQEVSKSLKLMLSVCGRSQAEVGRLIGRDKSTVSRKLNGHTPWELEELAILCSVMEAPVTALFDVDALNIWLADRAHRNDTEDGTTPQVTTIKKRRERAIPPTKWYASPVLTAA